MPLDHFMQIVRHRKDVAFLVLEQLKLFVEGVRDVGDDAAESFFSAHQFRDKKPPTPKGRGRGPHRELGVQEENPCVAKKSRLPFLFRAEVHGDLADSVGAAKLGFLRGDAIQRLAIKPDRFGHRFSLRGIQRL